jgi:hypothetical protein
MSNIFEKSFSSVGIKKILYNEKKKVSDNNVILLKSNITSAYGQGGIDPYDENFQLPTENNISDNLYINITTNFITEVLINMDENDNWDQIDIELMPPTILLKVTKKILIENSSKINTNAPINNLISGHSEYGNSVNSYIDTYINGTEEEKNIILNQIDTTINSEIEEYIEESYGYGY